MTGFSERFDGFPGVTRSTAIPNLFFSAVLPGMEQVDELLAFLWVSRLVQEQRGDARFVTAPQLWATPGVAASFTSMGTGEPGLHAGLDGCARRGVLLTLGLHGAGHADTVYFVNNPASRRAIARARAGDLLLRPGAVPVAPEQHARPTIFRLYEEQIGTITPIVGDRLVEAAERYPADWIEDAFREAAEINARSWRYIDRILQRWAEEGRAYETAGRDSLEDRKRRYLG